MKGTRFNFQLFCGTHDFKGTVNATDGKPVTSAEMGKGVLEAFIEKHPEWMDGHMITMQVELVAPVPAAREEGLPA